MCCVGSSVTLPYARNILIFKEEGDNKENMEEKRVRLFV
jgi:hypothetical protein